MVTMVSLRILTKVANAFIQRFEKKIRSQTQSHAVVLEPEETALLGKRANTQIVCLLRVRLR
jgi:hypothetical protein